MNHLQHRVLAGAEEDLTGPGPSEPPEETTETTEAAPGSQGEPLVLDSDEDEASEEDVGTMKKRRRLRKGTGHHRQRARRKRQPTQKRAPRENSPKENSSSEDDDKEPEIGGATSNKEDEMTDDVYEEASSYGVTGEVDREWLESLPKARNAVPTWACNIPESSCTTSLCPLMLPTSLVRLISLRSSTRYSRKMLSLGT